MIRSKKANLTIRSYDSLEVKDPRTIETVGSCLYEMSRVEKIDFAAIPGETLEEIFRNCPKSAPQLHTLCLRSLSYSKTPFSINDDFLYDTGNLQHVGLINCKISWDSRLLTGLTYLNLQNSLKWNSGSSIIQVLQALRRMPALTGLHLIDSIPDNEEGPFPYAVLDLPCLRVLHLSSGVGAVTTILRHINFPRSAIIYLTCGGNQSIQSDFSCFLSLLATKFLSTLVIRNLRLQVPRTANGTHDIKFYLWTTAPLQDSCPTSPSQLRLVLKWPTSQPHNYAKALIFGIDAMNLSFLTELQIEVMYYFDSETWVKTFGKLPLLERVCLQRILPPSLLEALVYKTKAAEKSEAAYLNVSLPKLRNIHLVHIDFWDDISFDTLLDCLMERCERNAEIQVLQLEGCSFYSESSYKVERLKEVVVDVIWDGPSSHRPRVDDNDL